MTYEKWFLFNVSQRRHWNALEMLIPLLPVMLTGGINHPDLISYCGSMIILSRFLFLWQGHSFSRTLGNIDIACHTLNFVSQATITAAAI